MAVVFGRVIAIFSHVLLGFIVNRKKILPDESRKYLINLMMYITAPCMAASSIYMKELSPQVVKSTFQVVIGAAVFFVVATVFSIIIVKILKFKPIEETGLYVVAITSVNNGFMGFPVTKAIFGEDIFYFMVMHNVISCFYLYGVVPLLLKMGRKDVKANLRSNLKDMLNPCIIGIIIGVVCLVLNWRPPKMVNEVIIYLSDMTIPLSMIIIGVQLGSSKIMEILKHKYINLVNIFSMFAIPILTFLAVERFSFLDVNVRLVIVFASVFPAAVVPAAIAEQQGIKSNRLAEVVSLTTLISLITLPIAATFLMKYYF